MDFQRPVAGVCLAYRSGLCEKGDLCKFVHDEDDGKVKQIFLGNLHHDICEDELVEACEKYGKVTAVRWGVDRRSGKFKNFAHVEFITSSGAEKALALDSEKVLGRPLRASLARGPPQSTQKKDPSILKTSHSKEKNTHAEKEEKPKHCLNCRANDHVMKDCPNLQKKQSEKICYNCGDKSHRASKCRRAQIGNGFTFASCFICSDVGHLSSQCPKNSNGVGNIYPNGGGCRICGENSHLASACPAKRKKRKAVEVAESPSAGGNTGDSLQSNILLGEANSDSESETKEKKQKKKKKHKHKR